MPKNKGKGGKRHRRSKHGGGDGKRALLFAEDGQAYARITQTLGNGRFEGLCSDGQKRLMHVRGAMRKRVWVAANDLVLIGLRDFQDGKADIIYRYQDDEARTLHAYEEIPRSLLQTAERGANGDGDDSEDDFAFEFAEDADDIVDLNDL